MSRVGLKPIKIPSGVTLTQDGGTVTVKGPKGTITKELPTLCDIKQEGEVIKITRPEETTLHKRMHGLARSLLNNMVIGVSQGFEKNLEIVGVGFKAESKGNEVVLNVGLSHPVNYKLPEGVTAEVPEPTKIRITGIEKDKVGQVAAELRGFRPPEPYKGKGVRYAGEAIKRKVGKAAVGSGG